MKLKKIVKYGDYIFEKIGKDQMLEFVYEPEAGEKIYMKYLGL